MMILDSGLLFGPPCIIAEHRVVISDEAVDTKSLHNALQMVEILFTKLIFRFFIIAFAVS